MAPPWHSSDGQWRSHRITQIWRAYDADRDNEPALIFTTSEGQQIQGQLAEPAPSTLHGHELLVTVGQPQTGNDEPLREGKPVRQSARRKGAKAS